MEMRIAEHRDGKKFNRFGDELIDCAAGCGRKTTMLGTKLCDYCWEKERHDRRKEA
jgi:hypothetical protein